jgi:bifunctional DNA-binding transcriptional regulator/antitoxin component of YhaV-PrlF toxin-antitoxin module
MAAQRFETELERRGQGAVVVVPFDVRAAYGRARPPVRGTVNGHPFRTTIAVYDGTFYLGFRREVREAAGIDYGDRVAIELERDEEPREVVVPDDLTAALAGDPEAQAAWDRLSYTHRREHVEAIAEAKRQETRERRVEAALALLREGRTGS